MIDLRDINNPDHFNLKLNGEWEFYWNKMLRPHDFKAGIIRPDYYGNVPSYWTDYPQESVKTEKLGYATYRLTVLLPEDIKNPLGIDLPVFDSSYDIYIDGKYLGGNGIPGRSAIETKPEYRRNFYRIIQNNHLDMYNTLRPGYCLNSIPACKNIQLLNTGVLSYCYGADILYIIYEFPWLITEKDT